MKEVDVVECDPVQLRCTTSSTCKRSCLVVFITVQFAVICILAFTLKNIMPRKGKTFDENSNWKSLPDRMERLNENPVYAKFNITRQQIRPRVNLLIVVSSAPNRGGRRLAIRETWWNQSRASDKITVKSVFITDLLDNSTEMGRQVLQEQHIHKDIVFQKMKGGIEFGKRFLYHMIWALQNYDFDYFMRMDDDYFFCLERFIHELPMPMKKRYHWGYVHCIKDIVRPEESIILFSRDLVETLLDQDPNTIKGHPWADQMIATWVRELELEKLYNHDTRLHHHPPLIKIKNVTEQFKNVCRKYIGVHGSYVEHMRMLWKLRGGREYIGVGLDEYTEQCSQPQIFLWTGFTDFWRYKPKNLIEDPVWDTFKQDHDERVFKGRQEGQG